MIKLETLSAHDLGRKVLYKTDHEEEKGVLSSFNEKIVWVRFKGPNGEACAPETISFIKKRRKTPGFSRGDISRRSEMCAFREAGQAKTSLLCQNLMLF